MWDVIKKKLILPYLDVDSPPISNLGIEGKRGHRTEDQVTIDAAEKRPERRVGVAVKCATITPDEARVEEFGLKKMWRSPKRHDPQHPWAAWCSARRSSAATCRASCPGWTRPIVIGRHAFGDQYRATDMKFPGPGKLSMKFVGEDGTVIEHEVYDAPRLGCASWGCTISDASDPRFRPRLDELRAETLGWPLYLSTKNTILKAIRRSSSSRSSPRSTRPSLPTPSRAAGIWYEHRLIDDMVALRDESGTAALSGPRNELRRRRAVRHGRAGLFGSLGLMTSHADDARRQDRRKPRRAHGTVTRHLSPAPEGRGDLDQFHRLDLRLDRRAQAPARNWTATRP